MWLPLVIFGSILALKRNQRSGVFVWREYYIWIDTTGRTRLISNSFASASLGNLMAEIKSISNAGVLQQTAGMVSDFTVSVSNALYPSVGDVATVVVVDSTGYESRILIPAPKASIFLADGQTVMPSVLADVLAAARLDDYVNPLGNVPTSVLSGLRSGKPW